MHCTTFPRRTTARRRAPIFRRLGRALALVLLAAVLASCYTTPITNRSQFIVISRDAEVQLGADAYKQALEEAKLSQDPALQERVRRVGMRLVEAAGQTDYTWEFNVIDDDKVINAWALPGGKVAVYTGILNLTAGDDGMLATVMGHEIAHAVLRHGAERITQQLGVNVVAAGLQIAMKDRDPETVGLVMGAFGIGSNLALELPFSRTQEAEADHVGLIFMARAGYPPAKAIEFWKKMSAAAGPSSTPEFLSTHPSYETRVANLEKWQSEAMAEYQPIEGT